MLLVTVGEHVASDQFEVGLTKGALTDPQCHSMGLTGHGSGTVDQDRDPVTQVEDPAGLDRDGLSGDELVTLAGQ